MAKVDPEAHGKHEFTCVRALDGGRAASLTVRAQPGAKRAGFTGFWHGLPRISVTAPPDKGRANEAIATEIARLFGLRSSAVTHVAGSTSREKTFRLECAPGIIERKLAELVAGTQGDEA